MRQKRDICPQCKAPTEPSYRFCLACGAELPEREVSEEEPLHVAIAKSKHGTRTCPHCEAELDTPASLCPICGGELDNPVKKRKKDKSKDPPADGRKRRPVRAILTVLLLLALLGGGAAVMLAPGAESVRDRINLASLSDIQIPRLVGDDEVTAGDKPAGVVSTAIEARIVSVADDGLVRIRVEGEQIDVSLSGMSPGFVTKCLGEKALARVRRILVDESIVYVALDGEGGVNPSSRVAIQNVYIWHYDPETAKVRFVNEELLASGEVAFTQVKLADSEPGIDLAKAAERAEAKVRGRYEPGACN